MAIWLGMAKAGVCTALVNVHAKGPPLVHAIRTALNSSKRHIIVVDGSLAKYVACPEILAELSPEVSQAFSREHLEFTFVNSHTLRFLVSSGAVT